jgi:hypothetical protein
LRNAPAFIDQSDLPDDITQAKECKVFSCFSNSFDEMPLRARNNIFHVSPFNFQLNVVPLRQAPKVLSLGKIKKNFRFPFVFRSLIRTFAPKLKYKLNKHSYEKDFIRYRCYGNVCRQRKGF